MQFHDIRLPNFIEICAIGHCEFLTSSLSTITGREIITLHREYARQKYIIKNCFLNQNQFEEFNNFFRARRGRVFSFRLRDCADYRVMKQMLPVFSGDIVDIQLFKTYDDKIMPYVRKITKPIIETIELYSDLGEKLKLLIEKEHNGIISIDISNSTKPKYINFEFDVCVTFAQNNFKYVTCNNGAIKIEDLELLEDVNPQNLETAIVLQG